jgi:DNA-binding CsgD family transcriptional regulator
MTERKTITELVGLLFQGFSSASIAVQLNLSSQTIWAVKGNLTRGKYKAT